MTLTFIKGIKKGASQKSCLTRRTKRVSINQQILFKMIEIKDLNTVEGGPMVTVGGG